MKTKTILNKSIDILRESVDMYIDSDCTFWACDGTPENNRIISMKTCSRCQSIILINRKIKELEKMRNML